MTAAHFVEELVPRGARVLELGCGAGDLLAALAERRGCRVQGVERREDALLACIARGIPVVQADLDDGLPDFEDGAFDVVILSRPLQRTREPARVLREMMRVGRLGVVPVANAGHWRRRLRLAAAGRVPVDAAAAWHTTPDIRPATIRDVEALLRSEGIPVRERRWLGPGGNAAPGRVARAPNVLAAGAVFVVGARA